MNASIKSAVFAIFTQADDASMSFADQLAKLGITERSIARPLATEWASKKYAVPMKEGQRGMTLDATAKNYDAAKKAAQRVLSVCFPAIDMPQGMIDRTSADPVEQLLKRAAKLDRNQLRRLLNGLTKL